MKSFKYFDLNNNGTVEPDEFAKAIEKIGIMIPTKEVSIDQTIILHRILMFSLVSMILMEVDLLTTKSFLLLFMEDQTLHLQLAEIEGQKILKNWRAYLETSFAQEEPEVSLVSKDSSRLWMITDQSLSTSTNSPRL